MDVATNRIDPNAGRSYYVFSTDRIGFHCRKTKRGQEANFLTPLDCCIDWRSQLSRDEHEVRRTPMRTGTHSDDLEALDRRGGTEEVTTEVDQNVLAAATLQRVHAEEVAVADLNAVSLRATLKVKADEEVRVQNLDEVIATIHLDAGAIYAHIVQANDVGSGTTIHAEMIDARVGDPDLIVAACTGNAQAVRTDLVDTNLIVASPTGDRQGVGCGCINNENIVPLATINADVSEIDCAGNPGRPTSVGQAESADSA